jgi:hypothetical protein
MTDVEQGTMDTTRPRAIEWEVGGLRLRVSFRKVGATLRVYGPVAGEQKELLRFDDFVEEPHYHVPAEGDQIFVDRSAGVEPLEFFVTQLRDHLPEMLTAGGFTELLPSVDVAAVSAAAGTVRQAMIDCVPEGFVRVPGVGLQRTET